MGQDRLPAAQEELQTVQSKMVRSIKILCFSLKISSQIGITSILLNRLFSHRYEWLDPSIKKVCDSTSVEGPSLFYLTPPPFSPRRSGAGRKRRSCCTWPSSCPANGGPSLPSLVGRPPSASSTTRCSCKSVETAVDPLPTNDIHASWSLYKPIGIYVGRLILGVVFWYMVSASFSWSVKG